MRPFVFATVLSLVAVWNVSAQERPTLAQPQVEGQNYSYVPDLGDMMGATQLRHFKLWYAGKQKSWDLANYEVAEIRKSFDAASKLYPVFQNVALGKLIADVSEPALAEIDKSIKAKDSAAFSRSFGKLTDACNRCHRVANVAFIAIQIPTSSPFSNQSFSPTRE